MNSTTIAVDVATAVFEVAVSEHAGQVRERHPRRRYRSARSCGQGVNPSRMRLLRALYPAGAAAGPDAMRAS